QLGDRLAEAAGRARDQGDLAVETAHALLLCDWNWMERVMLESACGRCSRRRYSEFARASPASGLLRSVGVFGEVGVGGEAGIKRIVQARRLVAGDARVGNARAVAGAQGLQVVADVVEHQVGGVAATLVGEHVAV